MHQRFQNTQRLCRRSTRRHQPGWPVRGACRPRLEELETRTLLSITATGLNVALTEGVAKSAILATFRDSDSTVSASNFVTSIDWGDRTAATPGTVTQPGGSGTSFQLAGTHRYAEEGADHAVVTISDSKNHTSAKVTSQVTVLDAPLQVAGLTLRFEEGHPLSGVVATFRDTDPAGVAADYAATVFWGDGSPSSPGLVAADGKGGFTVSGTHGYADEGGHTITAIITDKGHASATAKTTAAIADAPLTGGGRIVAAVEGKAASGVVAAFRDADPSGAPGDYTATIFWGDGSKQSPGQVARDGTGGFTVSGSHTYGESGAYSIKVSIRDAGNASVLTSITTPVAEMPLSAAGTDLAAKDNTAFTGVVATFSDPGNPSGVVAPYTAHVQWGDGHTSSGIVVADHAVSGRFDVIGTNTYVHGGTFPVTVTILDRSANAAVASSHATVELDFSSLHGYLSNELNALQNGLDQQVLATAVPLMGQIRSSSAAHVIDHFLSGLLGALPETTPAAIQLALFNALGPSGLGLLKDSNGDGTVDLADIGVHDTGDSVTFDVPLHQGAQANTGQLNLNLALPGLPFQLQASGAVQAGVGFDYDLQFGVRENPGQAATAFLATSPLTLQVQASIPGLDVNGTLGVLHVEARDDSSHPSSFTGTYTVAVGIDSSGNLTVSSALTASANVNLKLSVGFDSSSTFGPRVTADFNMAWSFNAADPSQFPFGNTPSIAFNNVQLDLGSFFGGFVAPIVTNMQKVTKPLEPLADFLMAPIPALSNLSEQFNQGPVTVANLFPSDSQTIEDFAAAIHAINGLNPANLANGVVDLGSFTITDPRATDANGDSSAAGILTDAARTDVVSQISSVSAGAASFFNAIGTFGNSQGFQFPMLENPAKIFGLFLGQNTTLFTFTLPPFNLSTQFTESIPIIPFVNADASGVIQISAGATFGFDTTGFHTGNILDGFFIQNAQVGVTGGVGFGLSVGVPVLATANLDCVVSATVNLNLVDSNGSRTVYGSELASGNFKLNLSGSVTATLVADIETFFVVIYQINLGTWTVATFTAGSLAAGRHAISAVYGGNLLTHPSSAPVQTMNASAAAADGPAPVAGGKPAASIATLRPPAPMRATPSVSAADLDHYFTSAVPHYPSARLAGRLSRERAPEDEWLGRTV
jgi:hypothetical protein